MTMQQHEESRGSRAALGFLLAPPVAPLVFVLITEADGVLGQRSTDCAADATVLTLGVPIAYMTALVIGIPAYWALRVLGQLTVWPILFIGSIAGVLLPSVCLPRNHLSDYVLAGTLGLCSSLAFWLIGVRQWKRSPAT